MLSHRNEVILVSVECNAVKCFQKQRVLPLDNKKYVLIMCYFFSNLTGVNVNVNFVQILLVRLYSTYIYNIPSQNRLEYSISESSYCK